MAVLEIGLLNYFAVIFPAILVFVFVYAILQKIKILGEKKQKLDQEIERLYSKKNKDECRILFFLNIIANRIFHTNGAIMAAMFYPSSAAESTTNA